MWKENRGIPRPPLPEDTKEWVDGEQRVSHHHPRTIHFPPVTPYLLPPLPLFLPLSRVISSFTFLVSASSSHPPSRAPLTAFSRFPTLIHRPKPASTLPPDLDPLSILPVYAARRDARMLWEFVLGRTFNDASEKFWGRKKREGGGVLDRFLFSSRFSGLLFGGKRDRGKFSTGAAPRRREISSPRELCTGTVHNVFLRWREGRRRGLVRSRKEIFKRGVVVELHFSTFSR